MSVLGRIDFKKQRGERQSSNSQSVRLGSIVKVGKDLKLVVVGDSGSSSVAVVVGSVDEGRHLVEVGVVLGESVVLDLVSNGGAVRGSG